MIMQRYIDKDGGLDILSNLRIKASDPNSFNDPFEFIVGISKISPSKLKRKLKTKEEIDKLCQNYKKHGFSNKRECKSHLKEKIHDNVWLSALAQSIESDLIKEAHKNRDDAGRSVRVLCFATDTDSDCDTDILMWGHYTGKHFGIKIHFDTSRFDIQSTNCNLVEYSDERLSLDLLERDTWQETILKSLVTKSCSWSYEKEFRWIVSVLECKPENGNLYIKIPPESIVRIDIGINSSDELKKELFALLQKTELSHVEVYQAEIHPTLYKIEYKRLNPPFPLL